MSSAVETSTSTVQPPREVLPLDYPAVVVVSRPLDEIQVTRKGNNRLLIAEDERLHRYTSLLSAGVVVLLIALIQLIVGFGSWSQAVWLWGTTVFTLMVFLISIRPFGIRLNVHCDDEPRLTIQTTFLGIRHLRQEVDLREFLLSKGCRSVLAVGGTETIYTCVAVHPDNENSSMHLISSCKEGVIDRILNQIELLIPECIMAGQHMEPDGSRPTKPR